ncbi:MAG: FtsX-like permease family protein, partial [Cyclobacteriaceae bacterium]
NFSSVITLRLEAASIGNAIVSVEAKWKEIRPGEPFIYSFLDNTLENMYTSEKTSSKILTLFTTIAIVIACFGLFGLAAYSANQRTKEIGVRKVLGATVPNILNLLSQDFTRLVLISFLIGSPIAYFMMNEWLQSFAYRTSLTLYSFFAAGILILVITYVTISYQAIKAATANPVNSLKEE